MKISKRNKIIIWSIILVVVILFFSLPISIPYSINAPGKIYPAKEMLFIKGPDGTLITEMKDNIRGLSTSYSAFQFIRGDAIQFSFNKNISNGAAVAVNDTIAFLYSNELERELIDLRGEIKVAQANLAVLETGEKKSIVEQSAKQVEYMKRQSAEQKRVLKNVEELYKKDLASQEEYELARSQSDLYEINIGIAEAQLQSVQTGVKKEEINLLRSQIKALQEEADALSKRFNNYTIISQINGIVNKPYKLDTLLIISDTTDFVVLIPVLWEERENLSINQSIQLDIPVYGKIGEVTISEIDNSVNLINNNQILIVTAKIPSEQAGMIPGLIVQSSIRCNPVRPIDYLKKIFLSIFG